MDFLIETRNFYRISMFKYMKFYLPNYLVSPWSSGLVREVTFWNWQMEGASSNLSENYGEPTVHFSSELTFR